MAPSLKPDDSKSSKAVVSDECIAMIFCSKLELVLNAENGVGDDWYIVDGNGDGDGVKQSRKAAVILVWETMRPVHAFRVQKVSWTIEMSMGS